jgi:hypothetical protein
MPGMLRTATTLATVLLLGIAPAAAQNDSFKKTEKGFGELLRGMGQELKKLGGGTKKDAKKEETKKAK